MITPLFGCFCEFLKKVQFCERFYVSNTVFPIYYLSCAEGRNHAQMKYIWRQYREGVG